MGPGVPCLRAPKSGRPLPYPPTGRRSAAGDPIRGASVPQKLSTGLSPTVENHIGVIRRRATGTGAGYGARPAVEGYFQRVAMTNAAASPPMPIRMFQLPSSDISGTFCPAR